MTKQQTEVKQRVLEMGKAKLKPLPYCRYCRSCKINDNFCEEYKCPVELDDLCIRTKGGFKPR